MRRVSPAFVASLLVMTACGLAGDRNSPDTAVRITFDARTRYQTIEGWGGVIANWHWVDGASGPGLPIPPAVREQALRELVFDLGLNRFGMDLPPVRIEPVNDNDDPFHTDPAGFDFSRVDPYIREMALPLRELVRSRGEPFVFYLNAVLWAPKPGGPRFLLENPDEYVEFAMATLRHFREQGLEVDYWVMQNEPDLVRTWTPGQLGLLITRLGTRMRAAGFATRIAAPENMRPASVAQWLGGIAGTPGAREYLGQVSYHSYDYDPSQGETPPATPRAAVADAARQLGLRVAQTEQGQSGKANSNRWSRSHGGIGMGLARNLFADVALADAAAWQLHAIAGWADTEKPVEAGTFVNFHRNTDGISKGLHYWTLRQVMRHVRPGAVRVATRVEPTRASARYDNPVVALGFLSPDKDAVLVVLNSGPERQLSIAGLPRGNYEVTIAAADRQWTHLGWHYADGDESLRLWVASDSVTTFRQGTSPKLPMEF